MRIRRLAGVMAALAVLGTTGSVRALNGHCSAPNAVKVAADCKGVTAHGCCWNDGVVWCEADGTALCMLACDNGIACGWVGVWQSPSGPIDFGQYLCGGSGGDPSDEHPLQCTYDCTADCAGKVCGTDGCFGTCGAGCTAPMTCLPETGQCCTPDCAGRQCGDDDCGGACGTCDAGTACLEGQCAVCTTACDGRTCGDDGCGGTCGTCDPGFGCEDGACVGLNYPDLCLDSRDTASGDTCPAGLTTTGCCDMMNRVVWCQNERLYCMVCETCGWSQTGSFAGYDCNQTREDPSGANVRACGFCDPACAGRQCGPDGCGGTCGTCGAGLGCDEQGHCAGYAPDAIDPDVAQPDAETDDVPLVVDTPLPDHPPPLDPGVDRTLVDTPVEEDVPADDIETPVPTHGGGCTSGAEAPALPCAMVLIGVAGLVAARRRRTLPDRP
jgi:hypothetical protein